MGSAQIAQLEQHEGTLRTVLYCTVTDSVNDIMIIDVLYLVVNN